MIQLFFPSWKTCERKFLKKSETTDTSTLLSEIIQDQHVPVLDGDIQLEEIESAHKMLKEDKATADG